MPMRIINLKGGGGPAPAPGGASDSGLYKLIVANNFTNVDPNSSTYVEIWEEGNKSKPRPESITIMIWGIPCWRRSGITTSNPPACGTAFGVVTLKGDDIPQKLYVFRGKHQTVYPYTYPNDRGFGFNKTASRSGAWILPNMLVSNLFTNTDLIAPDAVSNHWGEWDYIANGGNGKFTQYTSGIDSCGSNGSLFGDGKTSTGKYPSSCGNPGTNTERGRIATGIEYNSAFDFLKSVLSFGTETTPTPPSGSNINSIGGNGGVVFMLTEGVEFGMLNGVPFSPEPVKITLNGGPTPTGRIAPNHSIYSPKLNILYKF